MQLFDGRLAEAGALGSLLRLDRQHPPLSSPSSDDSTLFLGLASREEGSSSTQPFKLRSTSFLPTLPLTPLSFGLALLPISSTAASSFNTISPYLDILSTLNIL
jgi:hypothetical protein